MKIIINTLIMVLIAQTSYSQVINLEQYVTGLSNPTDISNAGDDRLFVVERRGKVKIIDKDGNVFPTPFIDIDEMVSNASGQDERGMLGIAFHPDFANNGYFFLNHTDNDDHTNVVRYQVDPMNPDIADPSTRELIIKIEQPYWNHNGGGIKFGPDGYLYIGMGDGGSGNDPQNNGQNKQSLLGKMLRLDVDNGLPYTIPADNPFVGDDTTLDEIWAIGMRNPWRFSFDKMTGDLWIGDVGQGAIEEVDFEPSGDLGGHNYGWRCYEGTDFTNNSSMANCNENYLDPIYEILHQAGHCSITGGYVYRGSKYTDILGHYIFTDYCSGDFFTVYTDENGDWVGQKVASLNFGISTFGEDVNGELYAAILSGGNGGNIYRLVGGVLNESDDIKEIEALIISPNPILNTTNLKIESNERINVELTLLDLTGKVIFSETTEIDGVFNKKLDLSDQPSGTYILNINTDKGLVTKKIIKQ